MSQSLNRIQVAPFKNSWERPLEEPAKVSNVKSGKCLCELLLLCFNNCKIFGMTPFTRTSHDKNYVGPCEFKISNFWKIYDIALAVVFTIFMGVTFLYHEKVKFVELIYAWIYLSYGILNISWSVINAPILLHTLNDLNEFIRHGLFCNKQRNRLMKIIWFCYIAGNGQFLMQITISLYLFYYSDYYEGLYELVLQAIIHNIPFLFTFAFSMMCIVHNSLFRCFHTYLERAISQQVSTEIHSEHVGKFSLSEHIDLARRMHERLRQSLRKFNRSVNPQLLIHISIELLMIILHLYFIIVSTVVKVEELDSAKGNGRNDLNTLFVVAHIVNLFLMLYTAEKINCTQRLTMELLHTPTTYDMTAEEYSQFRIFSIKLQVVPAQIMAGRLFSIDFHLIAPLIGSVVTYLLVALQFQWPTKFDSTYSTANETLRSRNHSGVNVVTVNYV